MEKCMEVTDSSLPPGLTDVAPMPYGYRRWNGAVWTDSQVDNYNRLVADIVQFHRDGYNTSEKVETLYRLSSMYDCLGKE